MKNRLTVLSNGDCVSLDDVRLVRRLANSYNKVELIYKDGVIFQLSCIDSNNAIVLRDEIVSIVNAFENDIVEEKEAEKLKNH